MSSTFYIMDTRINASETCVQEFLSLSDQLLLMVFPHICIFLELEMEHIPLNKPKALKAAFDNKVGHNAPLKLCFTKTGKLIVKITDIKCTQAVTEIIMLGVSIKSFGQQETITSRFVLHNIDRSICLNELA